MENMKKTIEEQIVTHLKEKKLRIVTAESCTGGMVASRIVGVAGASDVFSEGYITYSNEAKNRLLSVSLDTIEKYNVVSEAVALEMATGASKVSGAEVAVATTGFAGPGGGSPELPVGTVWIGCHIKGVVASKKLQLDGNRDEIRQKATEEAIAFVYQCIENRI